MDTTTVASPNSGNITAKVLHVALHPSSGGEDGVTVPRVGMTAPPGDGDGAVGSSSTKSQLESPHSQHEP